MTYRPTVSGGALNSTQTSKPADLRQICSVGKTMAVDDQPEIGV